MVTDVVTDVVTGVVTAGSERVDGQECLASVVAHGDGLRVQPVLDAGEREAAQPVPIGKGARRRVSTSPSCVNLAETPDPHLSLNPRVIVGDEPGALCCRVHAVRPGPLQRKCPPSYVRARRDHK